MECKCEDAHDIKEYIQKILGFKSAKMRIGFAWKDPQMKLFAVVLNSALAVQQIRSKLLQHECGKACFACRIKEKVASSDGVFVDDLIVHNEKLLKRVKDLKVFVEGIEFVLGIMRITRRLRVDTRFKCGFRAVIPVKSVRFDLAGYLQEICRFFICVHGRSLLFWFSNSALLKSSKTLTNFIYHQIQSQSYRINENLHSGDCCEAELSSFSNKFPVLYFELTWKASKCLAFDIAQVCVGLTDLIRIGDQVFYFYKFMARKEDNEDFVDCWKNEDGYWNVYDGDQVKMNLDWFSIICFMVVNEFTPCFFVYRVEGLPESPLSDIEIFKIEELAYSMTSKKICFKRISKIVLKGIPEQEIVHCFYCENEKYEGIECDICKFNETNWSCDCGWLNSYLFITCEKCNKPKFLVEGHSYSCDKCYKETKGLNFCLNCAYGTCSRCKSPIYGGHCSVSSKPPHHPQLGHKIKCQCQCKLCFSCLLIMAE